MDPTSPYNVTEFVLLGFTQNPHLQKILFIVFLCIFLFTMVANLLIIVTERLLLNDKALGFLASGGDEINPGPEMRLDRWEILCNKVLLKYKGDRESFWHRHQKGAKEYPLLVFSCMLYSHPHSLLMKRKECHKI